MTVLNHTRRHGINSVQNTMHTYTSREHTAVCLYCGNMNMKHSLTRKQKSRPRTKSVTTAYRIECTPPNSRNIKTSSTTNNKYSLQHKDIIHCCHPIVECLLFVHSLFCHLQHSCMHHLFYEDASSMKWTMVLIIFGNQHIFPLLFCVFAFRKRKKHPPFRINYVNKSVPFVCVGESLVTNRFFSSSKLSFRFVFYKSSVQLRFYSRFFVRSQTSLATKIKCGINWIISIDCSEGSILNHFAFNLVQSSRDFDLAKYKRKKEFFSIK